MLLIQFYNCLPGKVQARVLEVVALQVSVHSTIRMYYFPEYENRELCDPTVVLGVPKQEVHLLSKRMLDDRERMWQKLEQNTLCGSNGGSELRSMA